jgi:hypothetical protein
MGLAILRHINLAELLSSTGALMKFSLSNKKAGFREYLVEL